MSKDRARRRAEREAALAAAEALRARERKAQAVTRRRQQSRQRIWRSLRFWRSGTTPTHVKERRALVFSGVVGLVFMVWAVTRSTSMTIGVGLVALLAAPVALAIMSERSK